jgi:hypothetical protein
MTDISSKDRSSANRQFFFRSQTVLCNGERVINHYDRLKPLDMKTKMYILVLVSAAVLLSSAGVVSPSTSAYAQGSPLEDIPVIGDLMGGGQNQSQQQNQTNQTNQTNQSGGPLGNIPVIGEQLEKMNPMK